MSTYYKNFICSLRIYETSFPCNNSRVDKNIAQFYEINWELWRIKSNTKTGISPKIPEIVATFEVILQF
jgi:hypothetical protein